MNPTTYVNRPLAYETSEHSELLYPAVVNPEIESGTKVFMRDFGHLAACSRWDAYLLIPGVLGTCAAPVRFELTTLCLEGTCSVL